METFMLQHKSIIEAKIWESGLFIDGFIKIYVNDKQNIEYILWQASGAIILLFCNIIELLRKQKYLKTS